MIEMTQEAYDSKENAFARYKANAYTSCTVCKDERSFVVDCSIENNGSILMCNQGYTGSFVNMFNFGMITVEERMVEMQTNVTVSTNLNDPDRDKFC